MALTLWQTLLDDPMVVLERHAATIKALLEAREPDMPSDDPGERGPRRAPNGMPVTALQAIADAQVVRAMQGDGPAFAQIADRIEGKAGQRRGDIDPAEQAAREETRRAIESVVRHMADTAAARVREPTMIDITPADSDAK
jgi:hypothetical protein